MYLPLLKFNPPYNQTYRFHPAISTRLSHAIYGDAMACAVGADESDINEIWCSPTPVSQSYNRPKRFRRKGAD